MIVGLITGDENVNRGCADQFVDWCHTSSLQLNTNKTKGGSLISQQEEGDTNKCLLRVAVLKLQINLNI